MRPMRARKPLPHEGQKQFEALLLVLVAPPSGKIGFKRRPTVLSNALNIAIFHSPCMTSMHWPQVVYHSSNFLVKILSATSAYLHI